MSTDEIRSNQHLAPARSVQETVRLAWLVLGLALACFVALCLLAGYGLWQVRGTIAGARENNTLEAYAGPVFRVYAGETALIAVPEGQAVSVHEGQSVQVGERAPAGAQALITLWDGSTLQLYAGTRVTLTRLHSTLYSDRFKDIALEISSGRALLGVAQFGRYQEAHFSLETPDATVEIVSGGSYLLRVGELTEVAVRQGQARVTPRPGGQTITITAGQKATVQASEAALVEMARWQLLYNGDFSKGLDGWVFHSEQTEDAGTVDATLRLDQQTVRERPAWVVGLERRGGLEDRCLAVLSQEVGEDLSPYQSVRLDFDLKINYQSLPGGGVLGIDYPFNVRVRYQDAEGKYREYLYGFYDHTSAGYKTQYPSGGETRRVVHYRWEHISVELLDLRPRPVLLIGVDLFASGNDYLSWVTGLALTAEY